jgi:outer membrane protein assembly factor BamB
LRNPAPTDDGDTFRNEIMHPSLRIVLVTLLGSAIAAHARADDWPQWLGPHRDGVWREKGIVATFPKDGPAVRWRTPVAQGYAGPAVADGRVYVTDRTGAGPKVGKKSAGKERVLCLDEPTGKVLWKHEYDCPYQVGYPAGPRVTPIVAGGKVYTLGTMGDLLCLDAVKVDVIWAKNLRAEHDAPVQNWGFSAHPLLDGDRLICIVGGKAGAAAAFHKDTGKEIWKAIPGAEAGYAPPMIYEVAGKRQLIIWHPGAVHSLDPENGKPYWSQPFSIRVGLTIATPRLDGDRLFVTAFYNGPMMLKLDTDKPGASVLWRGKSNSEQSRLTDGLHCLMSTPVIKDGHIYGVCSYGQLRCLEASTGKRLWETFKATGGEEVRWGNAFLIPHEDRYFIFDEKGNLMLARLSPKGYDEISRARILEPTNKNAGRDVVWSHPAFANRSMYARNDKEIVCVSLAR